MRIEHSPSWQSAGPLTLLAGFALVSVVPFSVLPFDLFVSGLVGLYLCARWHIKGCVYALMMLALVGIAGHIFWEISHFWRLGVEASFACSFFIAALAFETEALSISGLQSQLASRGIVIQNLEEEAVRTRESAIDTQILHSQKIEELQKQCDEILAEKSTIEMLNDVLRKANAAHFDEKTALEQQVMDSKRNFASILVELGEVQGELSRFKTADLAVENCSLLKALNNARFETEQTRQINETLLRMHADERIRAQEAVDQMNIFAEESKALKADRSILQEHLAATEQKIHELAKVDFLYRQLKGQFEEKSRILHQARAALFKTETELQTLALEKEEQNPFLPTPLSLEFDRVDEEMGQLREENTQLQELVTYLTEKVPHPASFAINRIPLPTGQPSLEETLREALTPKRKKRVKKSAQQDLLF